MRIFRRKKFENEMDTEFRSHLDARAGDLLRSGLDPAEAERRARIEFGPVEAAKDECRQAWGLQFVDELRADLRLAFRTLRNNRGFAAIAILSLALGIGANTAIAGLMDAVMFRLLPVRDPGSLVFVQTAGTGGRDGPPYPYFELLRNQAGSFESMAACSASNMELVIDGGREQVQGVWVSGNFYEMLGVTPLLGRTLASSDDQTPGQGGPEGGAAVISRAYWQQRFGGDPRVVGRTVHIFAHAVTIVGVMPSDIMSLEPGRPIDIAVPMMLSDPVKLRDRLSLWLYIAARLKPAVPVEQARVESNALFRAYMSDVPISPEVRERLFERIELTSASQGLAGLRRQFAEPLAAMLALTGLVLLAACVNVANLMLARATARRKEFAVRLAIGAGRARLIRQTLTEALVLVGAGGALGLLFAQQGQAALAGFFAGGTNQIVLDLSLNARMLLFCFLAAVLSGLGMGILPALRASRSDPAAGLQSASRSVAGNRTSLRLGRALVVAQVALSTVLLAGAGLFLRTLSRLESVDVGFTREAILTIEVTPERQMYGTPQWSDAQAEILDRVRRIPGVRSAAWATMTPLSGRDRGAVLEIPGFLPRSGRDRDVHLAALSPGILRDSRCALAAGAILHGAGRCRRAQSGHPQRNGGPLLFRECRSHRQKGQVRQLPKPGSHLRDHRRGPGREAQQPSRAAAAVHLSTNRPVRRSHQSPDPCRALRGRCARLGRPGPTADARRPLHSPGGECVHHGEAGRADAAEGAPALGFVRGIRSARADSRLHRALRHPVLCRHAAHQ
jgi:predicted permease